MIENRQNLGAAKSRNIAAKKGGGEFLFFIDCDTIVKSGWSKIIIDFFGSYEKVAMVQTKILKMGSNNFDYAGDYLNGLCFLTERARGAKDIGQFDKAEPIFSFKGAAMIIRRDIFIKIGGFDEDYGYYWEEPDLAWRIWLAGYEVFFLPKITVYHAFGTNKKGINYYRDNDIIYKSSKNSISTLIKNLNNLNLVLKLPLHIASWVILSIAIFLKGEWKKSFSIARGIWWNIKNISLNLKKRRNIQSSRKITDKYLFTRVGASKNPKYLIEKGLSFVLGKPY